MYVPLSRAPIEASYRNRGPSVISAGSFRTLEETNLIVGLTTMPITRVIPPGPAGLLFGSADLTINPPPQTTPFDAFAFDAAFPDVLLFLENSGRATVTFLTQFTVQGNQGQIVWTQTGELGAPGAFTQPVPDPPVATFSGSTTTTNFTPAGAIFNVFDLVFPFANGEAFNRMSHDNVGNITIDIAQFTIIQTGRGCGPEVRR